MYLWLRTTGNATNSSNLSATSAKLRRRLRRILGARHGLIGAGDMFGGLAEESFDDDYGMRVVEGWRRMLIRFFTPNDHASHDAAAYDSFRLKVVAFATDIAFVKAVYLAKEHLFPNLILSLPDASHTLRIACQEPIHRDRSPQYSTPSSNENMHS